MAKERLEDDKRASTSTIKGYLDRYDAFTEKCREVAVKQMVDETMVELMDGCIDIGRDY